jgi:hypothetical protein
MDGYAAGERPVFSPKYLADAVLTLFYYDVIIAWRLFDHGEHHLKIDSP